MSPLYRILRHTRSLSKFYNWIALFVIIGGFLGLARPIVLGKIVDKISVSLRSGQSVQLWPLAKLGLIILALDLLSTVLGNIAGYVGDLMATRLKRTLSQNYYEKLMSLPQDYFDNELTGTVVNRLTRGIDSITRFVQMMSNNFITMFVTIIMSVVYMSIYSWPTALMMVVLIPLYFIFTRKTSAKWQVYERKINNHMDLSSGRFTESVAQVKVVKSFVQEARELNFFSKHYKDAYGVTRKQSSLWHREDIKRKSALNLINSAVIGVLIYQASKGTISPGQFTTIIFLVNTMSFPIANMSFILENAQRAITGSADYFKVIELEPAIEDKDNAKVLKVKKGQIKFEKVSFSYAEGQPVLKDITFAIEPDSKVALVGESGQGKTTITNLLMRLYEPQGGNIAIDGVSVNDVTQESLRHNIGVVFQDPSLFSGTIFENISYARANATKEAVMNAAKAANAHDFISELEKGYDSEIGERGVKLSGGQKQRIAIARALLKDAPILILDEATSSLDSKSESLVQEALETLMKNRTTIIIAHRLSTIANVDKIITLKKGQVDEIGSPRKLAASGGIYGQLLSLQNRSSEEVKEQLKAYELAG